MKCYHVTSGQNLVRVFFWRSQYYGWFRSRTWLRRQMFRSEKVNYFYILCPILRKYENLYYSVYTSVIQIQNRTRVGIMSKSKITSLHIWCYTLRTSVGPHNPTNSAYFLALIHLLKTFDYIMRNICIYRVADKKVLLRLSLVTLKYEQLESKLKMIQKAEGWLWHIQKKPNCLKKY